jgi:hypothetical protein
MSSGGWSLWSPPRGAEREFPTAGFISRPTKGPFVVFMVLGMGLASEGVRLTPMLHGRISPHGGYAVSQRMRKLVKEIFGWAKPIALLRKTRNRGRPPCWLNVHLRLRSTTWSDADLTWQPPNG